MSYDVQSFVGVFVKGSKQRFNTLGILLATTLVMGGSLGILSSSPASAQNILQEEGNLAPTQDEYTFSGTSGQSVIIEMSSPDFDTFLSLTGPDGQELAFNDDFARSLNSAIVITLPTTGTYTVLARSFSGQGGNYSVTVRPATPYEQAYGRAYNLFAQGNFAEAIAAYTEAISIDASQPTAYLERGDARLNQGSPVEEVAADYEKAAQLYEAAGDSEMAQALRDQIQYLQSPESFPEEGGENSQP